MNGFVEILEMQEDRGVTATINALKAMGVMRYNYERQVYVFTQLDVSTEALDSRIKKELGKH